MATSLFSIIAPHFAPYLEMVDLAGDSYYFRKESTALRDSNDIKRLWHPRIKHRMLRGYHSPNEGILYAALPKSALLYQLKADDLLYVGCSGSGGPRFWRGRMTETAKFPELRSCFHHEQMRRGRDGSNLENYLAKSGPIILYTMSDSHVLKIASDLRVLLPDGKYPAHRLERAILAEGFTNWKWNARS